MIYIDPPYNTANKDFVYNDTRAYKLDDLINAGMSEDEAKRVLEFSTKKSSSHSAWLTFMYPRLFLARKLLKDDGVIFISIDDNEAAQLKLLCDEIFGEENFVAQVVWTNKEGGGSSDSKHFRIKHEYIFVYTKNKENLIINGLDVEDIERYKLEDKHFKTRGKYQLIKLDSASIQYSSSLDYPIKTPDNSEVYPSSKNKKSCWRWGKEKLQWGIENDFVVIKKDSKNKWAVYTKQYLNCDSDGNIKPRTIQPMAIIDKYSTTQSNKALKELMGDSIFSYSKPVELIKYLLQISTDKDDIVLDFFAGSGTTGHAIMQLNAEDSGNRKFILVQLDEPIDEKKSKIAYDFVKNELNCKPTIYAITKERLIRAAKKIKQDYPNATNLDFSEFKIVYKDELELEKIEKLDLSLGDNLFAPFNNDKTNEILTSYKLADGIALDMEFKIININDYKAYYCNKLLYLVFPHFKSENIKTLMQKLQDSELICERVILYNASFTSSEHKSLKEALIKLGIKLQVRF